MLIKKKCAVSISPQNYNMISPWVEVIVGFYHKWLEVVSKFPSGFIIYVELSFPLME